MADHDHDERSGRDELTSDARDRVDDAELRPEAIGDDREGRVARGARAARGGRAGRGVPGGGW